MDDEAEMIRAQMTETRTALTEKLEALEEKVTSAVENTTESVTETVEAVKEAVEGTVNTVTDTAKEAAESVREVFDVPLQFRRRPWLMLGGSVAVGFVAGSLLGRTSALRALASGALASSGLGGPTGYGAPGGAPAYSGHTGPSSGQDGPSVLGQVTTALTPALDKLKGMAIAAAVGMAGEALLPKVPEAYRGQVEEVLRDVTTALGGNPSPAFGQHPHRA